MKKLFLKLNFEFLFYAIIILLTLIFFIKTDPIYYSDSGGYLDISLIRSCGYPLYISLHKFIFGNNFITYLLLSQYILTIYACLYLTKSISKTLNLNKYFLIILFGILVIPIVYGTKVANSILSESLAYPLFLIIVGHLLIAFLNKKNVYFYYSLFLTLILILVRGQFLFLIPAIIISYVFINYNELFTKKAMLIIGITILLPFLAILIDVMFHKIKHNQYTTTPWTGIQIATMPFFVSDQDDYKIFETKQQQEYFKFIYKKLEQKKLLASQFPKDKDILEFYHKNFIVICNSTINKEGETFFKTNNPALKTIYNDKITSSMTFPLIKNNFSKWLSVYLRNVAKGFDTSKMMIFYFILLLLSIYIFIKNECTESKFFIICLLLMFGNIFIVALAEPTGTRYIFYNSWILITIFLTLFQKSFLQKSDV